MWQSLRDNPEVVWGFLLALGVVLVLTPAVGRFARILGVVDQPGEARRLHLRPIPRLGGIALLLGIFVPALAFLELGGAYRGTDRPARHALEQGLDHREQRHQRLQVLLRHVGEGAQDRTQRVDE